MLSLAKEETTISDLTIILLFYVYLLFLNLFTNLITVYSRYLEFQGTEQMCRVISSSR